MLRTHQPLGLCPPVGTLQEQPHSTAMPDPTDELITILMAITRDPSIARPSGRLRPLLVGRPHPKRKLRRWGAQTTINAALARSKAAAAPEVLAHG